MKSRSDGIECKPEHTLPAITDTYTLTGKHLGDGGFAEVEEATHHQTLNKVALKRIQPRTRKTTRMFWNEITALKAISHPYILTIIDFHPDVQYASESGDEYGCHVVSLELAEHGDLFKLISETGPLEEKYAKRISRQLICGLECIHREGFCHRDIKLENILLDSEFNVKIADFGHSKKFDCISNRSECFTECGTPTFQAPEVLFRNLHTPYDGTKVDVWNAGVVSFIMMMGFIPFCMDKPSDWWFNKLKNRKYEVFWDAHCSMSGGRNLSEAAKHFINACFEVDPCARSSARNILEDFWFSSTTNDINSADFLVAYTQEMGNRIQRIES